MGRTGPARGPGSPDCSAWPSLAVVGLLAFRLLTSHPIPVAEQVVVPSFIGQTVAVAQPLADAKGLILVTSKFVKGDQPDGTIVDQDPKPDATVAKGATINLTIVTGKAVVPVPDVRNMDESEALKALLEVGLTPGGQDGRLRSVRPGRLRRIDLARDRRPGRNRDDRRLRAVEGPRADAEPEPDARTDPDPEPDPVSHRRHRRRPVHRRGVPLRDVEPGHGRHRCRRVHRWGP